MRNMELKVMKIGRDGVETNLPKKGTKGSAGLDLFAAVEKPVTVWPAQLVRIPTGVAVGLPGPGFVGLVFARSGLAIRHGIALSNGVGVIDSDYTGEILVGRCNLSDRPYTIEPGERIAQLIVMQPAAVTPVEVESLEETGRGSGGFGSTGKF